MRILISNDDGVMAPGIVALAQALSALGEVVVVAPEAERSGFSSALTLDRPLRAVQLPNGFWSVNGTPADCVYLAMNGLFEQGFDLLVSGINSGANLGDDVIYSGTVGAALEGRLMQLPALAISLVGSQVRAYQHPQDYAQAANWVYEFVKNGIPALPPRHIYNINIPDVPDLKGCKVTRMGARAVLIGEDAAPGPFRLPAVPARLRPMVEMLPVQMLSLALAALAGHVPGNFERASKVTVVL